MRLQKVTLLLWEDQVISIDAHADYWGLARSDAARRLFGYLPLNGAPLTFPPAADRVKQPALVATMGKLKPLL